MLKVIQEVYFKYKRGKMLDNNKKEEIINNFDKWYEEKNKLNEEVNKIDRQIRINKAIDFLDKEMQKDIDKQKKIDELVKMVDDKIIELALNDKSTIYLGKLKFNYDEKYKWYEALKEIDGKEVSIHSYGLNEIEKVLKFAVEYFEELDLINLKKCIADAWYENDKDNELEGISRETFVNNLKLIAIEVSTKTVNYWFDDNNMYGGHNIIVSKKHDEDKYLIDMAG